MSTRLGVHYGDYGNIVTSSNPYIVSHSAQIGQSLGTATHLPADAGNRLASYLLYGQTMKQATIDGINDSFIAATGIAFVALMLAFFIKRAQVKEQ